MIQSYNLLLKVLQENFGIVILEDMKEDFAINDYVTESISFIHFIIAIETEIGCSLSDDFLDFEILTSARGFAEKLDCFMASI